MTNEIENAVPAAKTSKIKVKKLQRTFTYNGVTLADFGPEFNPEEVRDMHAHANQDPTLLTAIIEMGEIKGDVQEIKFVKNTGTKG